MTFISVKPKRMENEVYVYDEPIRSDVYSGLDAFGELSKGGPITHILLSHFTRYAWVANQVQSGPEMKFILDLGCGRGELGHVLKSFNKLDNLTYIGMNLNMFEMKEAVAVRGERCEYVCVDILHDWPFEEHSLDYVACLEVLEHMPTDAGQKMLNQIARYLKPDGKCFLTTPIQPFIGDTVSRFHIHEYEYQELLDAVKTTDLEVVDAKGLSGYSRDIKNAFTDEEKKFYTEVSAMYPTPCMNYIFTIMHPEKSWNVGLTLQRRKKDE